MNARLALILIALPLALAGCGNKGPLVLPTKPIPVDPATLPSGTVPVQEVPATDSGSEVDPPPTTIDEDGRD